MKSSYELAMERLNKTAPATKLSAAQKNELAELDSKYKAKVAEREIFLRGEIQRETAKGNQEVVEQLERQLIADRKNLLSDLEEKKEAVRRGKA